MKQKISFQSSRGHILSGVLSDPAGNRCLPIMVLCHGLSTGKDGRTCVTLEETWNRKKISTFRFDFFGHGESEGDFADLTISEAVDNVRSALGFVKDSRYEWIGLFGSSFGGYAALLTASCSDELRVLTLKSPVSDYLGLLIARDHNRDIQSWKQDGFIFVEGTDGKKIRLNYSFFEEAEKISGCLRAENIKAPTLIVHGDRDETVPIAQSRRTADLIPCCQLEIIEGADHEYSEMEHFEMMIDSVSNFAVREAFPIGRSNE
jgi:pimeloyl-ACP methyl ester carboxylesterase